MMVYQVHAQGDNQQFKPSPSKQDELQ